MQDWTQMDHRLTMPYLVCVFALKCRRFFKNRAQLQYVVLELQTERNRSMQRLGTTKHTNVHQTNLVLVLLLIFFQFLPKGVKKQKLKKVKALKRGVENVKV